MKPAILGIPASPACDAATAITIELLPSELLLQILDKLSQHHLRVASMLSRRFRALAYEAGLYIHKDVSWSSDCGSDGEHCGFDGEHSGFDGEHSGFDGEHSGFEGELAAVEQLIDYATRENPGLNIALTVRFYIDEPGWDMNFYSAMSMFLVVFWRALPFLSGLDLCVPLPPAFNLYASLCANSAPRLRELVLEHSLESLSPIPRNLFNGNAARLRRVWLYLTGKPSSAVVLQPVAAFRHVTEVAVTIKDAEQSISISKMFPLGRSLAVVVETDASGRVDVTGLDLRVLAMEGAAPAVVPNPALSSIPIIEHECDTMVTFWPASRSELCARVARAGPGYAISFTSRTGSWRRSFTNLSAFDPSAPLPLAHVHFLPTQLVSLTLDNARVNAFVCTPLSLDALRELVLDLGYANGDSWTSAFEQDCTLDDLDSEAHARCPALERLVVLARGPGVTLRPTKLTRLARLLDMAKRPTLTLAGCALWPLPIAGALDGLFSAVEIAPTSDAHMPDYYERCRYEGQPEWEITRW